MNERIKRLRKEAWEIVNHELETIERDHVVTYAEHLEMHYAKFAELLVKECAQRIDYWESRQGEHCDDLLKHFGVTE